MMHSASITPGQTKAVAPAIADAAALMWLDVVRLGDPLLTKHAAALCVRLQGALGAIATAHGVPPSTIVPDGGVKPPSP